MSINFDFFKWIENLLVFVNIVLILKLKNTKNSEREYKYFISTYI